MFVAFANPVSAQSPDKLPTDVTILTEKDFIGGPYYSVSDVLFDVPSFKRQRDGSRGTQSLGTMRGLSSPKDTVVMIDGRPISHDYDSAVDLGQIPLQMVERIEINRSGGSAAYTAQGVGGTINIVTLRPRQKGLETRLGTDIGRDGIRDVMGYIMSRSNLGDLTYAGGKDVSGGYMTNEDFDGTNHFGNISRSFNGKGYWGVEYSFREARVGLSEGTQVPFSEWNGTMESIASEPNAQREQESQHYKALLAYPLIAGGTFYTDFTHSMRTTDLRATRTGDVLRHQKNETDTYHGFWRRKNFEFGAQRQQQDGSLRGADSHSTTLDGFYLVDRFETKRWTFAPGLRLDNHSESGSFLAPRLTIIYAPSDPLLFSVSAQRLHRTPDFEELFYSSGTVANPNLDDEKGNSVDAGISWQALKAVRLRSTYFRTHMNGVIAADPVTGAFENRGTLDTFGFENEIAIRLGEGKKYRDIELTGSWTSQKSERTIPDQFTDVEAAMSPRNVVYGRLRQNLPRKLFLTNELRYQSAQFEEDNRQGLRIPGFYTWNIRFGMKIWAADLFVQMDNVTRRRYAETIASSATGSVLSPQPEQLFWAGLTIKFIN